MSWPVVPAAELMVKRGGSVNPSKFADETFELLSIPAFDKQRPEILKGSQIGSSKSLVEPNDILLSKIVPHIRRCWVVPPKGKYRQIGSGEWIIFRDERFDSGFLKYFLTSDVFHRQFMNTVAGVGGSLVRARPAEVERIKIPLPPWPNKNASPPYSTRPMPSAANASKPSSSPTNSSALCFWICLVIR